MSVTAATTNPQQAILGFLAEQIGAPYKGETVATRTINTLFTETRPKSIALEGSLGQVPCRLMAFSSRTDFPAISLMLRVVNPHNLNLKLERHGEIIDAKPVPGHPCNGTYTYAPAIPLTFTELPLACQELLSHQNVKFLNDHQVHFMLTLDGPRLTLTAYELRETETCEGVLQLLRALVERIDG